MGRKPEDLLPESTQNNALWLSPTRPQDPAHFLKSESTHLPPALHKWPWVLQAGVLRHSKIYTFWSSPPEARHAWAPP